MSQDRDGVAEERDRISAGRDATSVTRDARAAEIDIESDRREREHALGSGAVPSDTEILTDAGKEREESGRARDRAMLQRVAAASDREHAAGDRIEAALDRQASQHDRDLAEVDEVTGALRRRVGLAAIQREMDRTRRSGEDLVVAFIDVDRLKHLNDDSGHAAGDELLRQVVGCVREQFRSYDIVARYGGDEFVCSFAGEGLPSIGARFARIGTRLTEVSPGAAITVGLSQRQAEDTCEALIERAGAAMIGSRRNERPA